MVQCRSTLGCSDFNNLPIPAVGWLQNKNQRQFTKGKFPFSGPLWAYLAPKFPESDDDVLPQFFSIQ
jgi:hypothetical protein